MAGKFEIYTDKAGEFRFRLKASNGQTILASEGYKAKAGCNNGIESVKKNASNDGNYVDFPEFSRHSIMSKLNWRVVNERYKIYS